MADTPVSPKVTAATVAAAVTTLVMYLLNRIDWVADMPEVVQGALLVLVSAGATFAAGYAQEDPLRVPLGRRYVDN